MPTTTDFEVFFDEASFYLDGDENIEIAYGLWHAIVDREGGEVPFAVEDARGQVFVHFDGTGEQLTLRLASQAAYDHFCRVYEKRYFDGDAETHIGFTRAINNPKS